MTGGSDIHSLSLLPVKLKTELAIQVSLSRISVFLSHINSRGIPTGVRAEVLRVKPGVGGVVYILGKS